MTKMPIEVAHTGRFYSADGFIDLDDPCNNTAVTVQGGDVIIVEGDHETGDLDDILSSAFAIIQELGWCGLYYTEDEVTEELDEDEVNSLVYLDCTTHGKGDVYVDMETFDVNGATSVQGFDEALAYFRDDFNDDR